MALGDWKDGKDGGTPLSAARLNERDAAIQAAADKKVSYNDLSDKPTIPAAATADNLSGATAVGKQVMKAADATAARTAVGAGTSNLKVGTAATDAAAGNHTHSYNDLSNKPTIPSTSGLAKQADLDAAVARIKALEDAANPPAQG